MSDSDDFCEKAYPSAKLPIPSRKNPALQHLSEKEHGITAIRGRIYSISPHKPSTKRKSRLSGESSRRTISFDQSEDSTETRERKKRHYVTKKKVQAEESSTELIENYGVEPKVTKRKKSLGAQPHQSAGRILTEELVFSPAKREEWQTISPDTLTMIDDILKSALKQSTAGLKGATKKEAESCLQSVLEEVNAELSISKAPKLNHPSLVPAKEMMNKLKTDCMALVQENNQLEERLNEATRAIEELESRRELLVQLQNPGDTHPSPETTMRAAEVLRERNNFEEYISKLLDT